MTPAGGIDETGAVIGLDPGSVRVGVAASDPTRTIASPVASVARDPATFWPWLERELGERDVRGVVVGLPRLLDGSEGDAATGARRFAAEVERRTRLPVRLWDERFTTAQAERDLITAGVRRRRRRDTIDAAAATLMLQSWLDATSNRRLTATDAG